MPQFARSLSVNQGFNFKHDKQTAIGYITKLTIGTQALAADFTTLYDPVAKATLSGNAVGVMTNFLWGTGVTDAIYISAQISTANKQLIQMMLLNTLTDMSVLANFVVMEYDQVAKVWFKSCFPPADLTACFLEKNGDELNIAVADDASSDVQSPVNFTMNIGIKPPVTATSLTVATANTKNVVKAWGITETQS